MELGWPDHDRGSSPRLPSQSSAPVWPSLSQSLSGVLFWLNIAISSRFEHLCQHRDIHLQQISLTQAFRGAMEAFIQMAVSLGSGLTQELLLLVRKDCMDSLSSPLSLCSSATIPPPLVPLKQHPHFSSYPNSLLLLLHHSRISSYFHLFVASVSMDSANQTKDGQITATSAGMGWGQSRQGYYNTQTHTRTNSASLSRPSLLLMYLSLRFTGWMDFITSTIICL